MQLTNQRTGNIWRLPQISLYSGLLEASVCLRCCSSHTTSTRRVGRMTTWSGWSTRCFTYLLINQLILLFIYLSTRWPRLMTRLSHKRWPIIFLRNRGRSLEWTWQLSICREEGSMGSQDMESKIINIHRYLSKGMNKESQSQTNNFHLLYAWLYKSTIRKTDLEVW